MVVAVEVAMVSVAIERGKNGGSLVVVVNGRGGSGGSGSHYNWYSRGEPVVVLVVGNCCRYSGWKV